MAYDATIPAKWSRSGRQGKKVRLLVAHCTVSKEMGTGAEAVAKYFAAGTRKASAHVVGDNNSVVSCVPDSDTAFAAAGANNDGWHFEFVGMPDQTAAQWDDEFSRDMLRRAAPYWRDRAKAWGIPLRWLTVAQVRAGEAGLCTHDDISKAYPEVSTGHWDPGPYFPKAEFLELLVKGTDPPEEDMPPSPAVYVDSHGTWTFWKRGDDLFGNLNAGPEVNLGGNLTSGPTASGGSGLVLVAARGTDGNQWLYTFEAKNWPNPGGSWTPVGGRS